MWSLNWTNEPATGDSIYPTGVSHCCTEGFGMFQRFTSAQQLLCIGLDESGNRIFKCLYPATWEVWNITSPSHSKAQTPRKQPSTQRPGTQQLPAGRPKTTRPTKPKTMHALESNPTPSTALPSSAATTTSLPSPSWPATSPAPTSS